MLFSFGPPSSSSPSIFQPLSAPSATPSPTTPTPPPLFGTSTSGVGNTLSTTFSMPLFSWTPLAEVSPTPSIFGRTTAGTITTSSLFASTTLTESGAGVTTSTASIFGAPSLEPVDNALGVLVRCRLCNKQYNESEVVPVSFPSASCNHTVCRTCGVNFQTDSKQLQKCPLCLSLVVAPKPTETLKPNGSVVPLCSLLSQRKFMDSGKRTCDECETKSACVSCSDCETALCSACDTAIHSHKIFRGHVRVPFSGHFPVREPRCTAHNKTFELFCPNCTELCCYGCSQFGNHKEHSSAVVLRSTAVPRVKSLLKSGLEEVKNSQVQIQKCTEDIDTCLSRLNSSSAALKTSISTEIQKIQQALARRQKILEEEVETKCGIISEPLLQSKRDLNLLESNTTKTIQAVAKILELDDELILLGASKLALGELSSAKTVTPHLPVINPNQDFVLPTFQGTKETLSAILQLTLKSPIGDTTTTLPTSGVHLFPLLSAVKPEPEQAEVEKLELPVLVFPLLESEQLEPEQPEQGKESSNKCSLVPPINHENCHWWPGHTGPTLLPNEANTAISPQTPELGVSASESSNDVGKPNERQQQESEPGEIPSHPQSISKTTHGSKLQPLTFDPTKILGSPVIQLFQVASPQQPPHTPNANTNTNTNTAANTSKASATSPDPDLSSATELDTLGGLDYDDLNAGLNDFAAEIQANPSPPDSLMQFPPLSSATSTTVPTPTKQLH
ncbi:hypothetical protein Pelo_1280 [Pelomyxa schiedti]|nr:hypothetical protein Pelo_1280 [Pelomyxa schiedti]